MKKIVFGLIAISSIAMAKEIVPAPAAAAVEPAYVAGASKTYKNEGSRNIYFRVGGDVYSQYNDISADSFKLADETADGFGFEGAIEYTKMSIDKKVEMGLGIAFQRHADFKSSSGENYYVDLNNNSNYLDVRYHSDLGSFDSIPLYVTAKYNFPSFQNGITPYVKGDVGYSFNLNNDGEISYVASNSNGITEVGYGETEVKNGAYAGIGVGIEYNYFLIDLMFKANSGKIKSNVNYITFDSPNLDKIIDIGSLDIDESVINTRVTLSVGYRFNF